MTEEITAVEILKSKQNFSDYIDKYSDRIISKFTENYPKRTIHTILPQLTQSDEGLLNGVQNLTNGSNGYFFWFVVNPKERHIEIASKLNNAFSKDYGIFIFKASLNENKIDFECLLKPELVVKQKREVNKNTPSKQLQKAYWETYISECDMSDYPDMQIKEALPRHYQNVSIGKAGVQILQTINTQNNYVASEISINNNKDIFEKLLDHKEEIEKEIGKLEWDSKENTKSSKIRKIFNIDVNNSENHTTAAREQVKMGAELKNIVHKYL